MQTFFIMKLRSIDQVKKLNGKKVLVRVDFNVPIKRGKVASDFKIKQSLKTIKFLANEGAKIILVSHLGRPSGKDKQFSLLPVVKHLRDLMKKDIDLMEISSESEWSKLKERVGKMISGEIVMLENIRYLNGEESESKELSKKLAGLADMFVLDGFAVAHRKASSVTGVAKILPAYAGLLLSEEVNVLSRIMNKPLRPLTVLLGGAKAETKIPVMKKLMQVADRVLVGGGIYNTYLSGKKEKIGSSLVSKNSEKEVLKYCKNKKIVLPVDAVIGKPDGKDAEAVPSSDLKLAKNKAIYDIGPASVRLFAEHIKKSKTLIWNGALGMFEQHPYEYGTYSLVRFFASRSKGKAVGVCGGGESVEILEKLNLMDDLDLVSTGGGAMLEFLSGKKLPGLQSLIK